jgi:hypothetical protein
MEFVMLSHRFAYPPEEDLIEVRRPENRTRPLYGEVRYADNLTILERPGGFARGCLVRRGD